MSNLTILKTSVSQLDNLYSLTDLHRISGNESKHAPNRFARLDQTKELIAEIQAQEPTVTPIKTLRGTQGGTYACKELVIAYAAWISPAFHLTVLRAFLNQVENLQNPQPNLPLAEEPKFSFEQTQAQWLRFASVWYALYNCVELLAKLDKPLHTLGSHYAAQVCGHATEYKTTLGVMQRLLVPMFEQFEVDPLDDPHYYKALNTLRNYKPQGLGAIVRV
ncbi:bacteriocin [Muribacter muris]|uniref:Bacteriocin n=1 Tax=Muribacter muris TaxID=67855 RepID=A0A4Y9JPH9_9PAST|nr:P22AR C-terminal domain-containing protein [Muribacter muris]MBF0786170.1 KilA-N domain-containing protein [Muribacter muris]MBF0828299.1 KilA-N domain-containing protein [Muribacter muris]TFV07694.1 bacteriocin [Muribacter muris]